MSKDEFTETPYAASFGPIPVGYKEEYYESSAPSADQTPVPPPVAVVPAAPEPSPPLQPPLQPPIESGGDRRYGGGTRRSHVPSVDKVVMDDSVKTGLAAVERLAQIDLASTDEWDETVQVAVAELRSIQLKWIELEAERKLLVKPTNQSSTQAYATRGVKRRGRGRGRRRGRWRGV